MRITKKELEEFKNIYEDEFGIKLENREAMEKALNVLNGVELILKFERRSVNGIDKDPK